MRRLANGVMAAFLMTTSMTSASVTLVQVAAAQTTNEDKAIEAFFNAGYAWCDAKVLSQLWNNDPITAKVWAGEKIQRGDQAVLDEVLGQAFAQFRCNVAFDMNDAEQLASVWGGAPA